MDLREIVLWVQTLFFPAGKDAWQCYDSIQRALVAQAVTVETQKCAQQIFPKQGKFLTKLNTLRHDTEVDPDFLLGLDGKYDKAYFDFMKMPASKDVLYEFLVHQQALLVRTLAHQPFPASDLSWGWSNLAQAAIEAYRQTKEKRFVEIFLAGAKIAMVHTDDKMGIVDSFGQENLTGWSINTAGKSGREITTVARIASPMIEMALVTRDDKSLPQEQLDELTSLAKRATEILKPYLGKQQSDGNQRYFLNLWSGEQDAINHMAAFAQACVFAYDLTKDVDFLNAAVGFRSYFMAHVTEVQGDGFLAYTWPYQVLPSGQYEEPFWKGAVTVPALIKMNQNGVEIDGRSQGALVASFKHLIIRKFYGINGYISERDFPLSGYNSHDLGYSNGVGFTQYVLLDEWASDIRDIVLTAIASRRDLFPRGFLMYSSDAIGYAHMLKPLPGFDADGARTTKHNEGEKGDPPASGKH